MPRIVDYPLVADRLTREGLVSLYPNSGAFGFPPEAGAASVGWIGPDDPSIRPASLPLTRRVPPPHEAMLATLATRVWKEHLSGAEAWVLPTSHWAYELTFGSHEWLPELLSSCGISPDILRDRHDGSALRFSPDEAPGFEKLISGLLLRLFGSDFQIAWPGCPAVCTVHHHKQLWWSTTDPRLVARLDELVPP